MSPNARSCSMLTEEGWLADVTERRITSFCTRDLFNVFDLLAVKDGITLAVQATTASNASSRRKKLLASDALPKVRAANWRVELHAWRKKDGNWMCKREVL
jgi:hypothetical protein